MGFYMDHDAHREVIRRLFTVAGTRLEAAAESAGAGQAADLTDERAKRLANDLVLTAQALSALGEAIILLTDRL